MDRYNAQGREIWFDRVLWSYMPSHWKGWALALGIIAAGNGTIWLTHWILGGGQELGFLAVLVGLLWVVPGLWLFERHSPSRG